MGYIIRTVLRLYYSEDQGLLDNEAYLFKAEYGNVRHVKRLTASDLELLLIQRNLDSTIENLIIEHYKGSLDVLDNILQYSGVENVLILLSEKPTGSIIHALDNSDWEIKKLNETTKKGYLNAVLSKRYPGLKISKSILKEIKDKVPPCASTINDLVENVASLERSGSLDENTLMGLVGDFKKRFNFFDFLKLYLEEDWNNWIYFLNSSVICDDTFRKFLYSLSYQLLELKKYLSVREKFSGSKEISVAMKVPVYVVSGYRKIFERYEGILAGWLNNFIIELYTFQFSIVYSFSVNCLLVKWFLLKKRKELANMGFADHVG